MAGGTGADVEDEEEDEDEGRLKIDESDVADDRLNADEKSKIEAMNVDMADASAVQMAADTEDEGLRPRGSYMFNIADGGFTELHTIWLNEQRALQENTQHYEIWHRKHDYCLLAGVVQHGYGRWQDIHNDPRFTLVNEPFQTDQGKPNYLEMKNRFLARRFKLLEQALIIEEQLRRAAHQNIVCDPKDTMQSLNRRFNELECLAVAQQQVYAEALAGNKSLVQLIHRALTMMEDYLAEMKQDVTRLLTLAPRMPPVSDRLNLSHTGLLTQLTQHLTAAKQAKLALLQQQQQQQQQQATSNPATPTETVTSGVEEKC